VIELVLLGLAPLAAVAAIALVEALVRRAELGAGLLLGAMLVHAILVGRVPSVTLPGGIRIQLHDVVFALVLVAGILRMLRMRRFSPPQRWVVVLCIVLVLSLVRGSMEFGPQQAIAEFRLFFAFVSGALYFSTFTPSARVNDQIGKLWLATSVPLMVLVCLRWLDSLAGIHLGVPTEQFGNDAAIKVVNGPYAFFLALAALLTVPFWQRHDKQARKLVRLGTVLLLFVVLLNRRTVWLTTIIGMAVLMVRGRQLRRRAVGMVIGGVLLAVGAYVALGGSSGEQSALRPATGTGTLDWRIQGWSVLLDGLSNSPLTWLIGEPLGGGFTRVVQGLEVQAEAHDFYVTTLLRTGVVGLVALIALTVGLLRALWRTPPGDPAGLLAPGVFPALLAMQAVFFLVWETGMEQGIITGLAVGIVTAQSRGAVPVPQPRLRSSAVLSSKELG
jgi:hypothetical protein